MERGPSLACVEGSLVGQSFPITAEGARIGRDPGNEIRVEDGGVSRQHARVLLHNGAVWVQDAGSRNGIFVNGERVPDHRQVKVGDRVSVGNCVFVVTAAEATSRASLAPPSRPAPPPAMGKPKAGWKIWPFVVALFLAVGIVVCIGALGGRGEPEAQAPAQPTWSLSAVIEPQAGGAAPPAAPGAPVPPAAPTSVSEALAVAAGADAEAARAQLPDPPPGVTSAELVDRAAGMMDAGRLNDARTTYRQALKLDPACELCKVRIAKLDGEITSRAQQQFDVGMRYYDSMQIPQAVGAWETVLMLVPDPADPMHVRAVEYLERARGQAAGRP